MAEALRALNWLNAEFTQRIAEPSYQRNIQKLPIIV
jgi:hypothetical protein